MKNQVKKLLLLVTAIVALTVCFAFGVSAEEYNGLEYAVFADEAAYIVGYSGSDVDLVIPSTIDGKIVWSLGHRAFNNCKSIKSIVIPDTVTDIGNSVFYNCENLSKITLPDNDIHIGISSFYNTAYYNDDKNWDNGILYIGKHLVKAKENISGNYAIKEGTLSIAEGAFFECENMIGVTIPDTVNSINGAVFSQCKKLKKVLIPDSVTSIGVQAFYNCTNLSDVYYSGTENEWNNIMIYVDNEYLTNATIHFNHKHIDLTSDGICDDCTATVGVSHTHIYTAAVIKAPTCTATGTKIFTCSCGDTYTETIKATGKHTGGTATCTEKAKCTVCKQSYGNLKSHTYKSATTKATLKKNGKIVNKCTACGKVSESKTVYKVKSVKLSATEYTYNGKTKTPSVTVKDGKGKTLKKGTDYTVTYPKKRKSIGKYTVTVTFKGNYSGTKKLTFTIVPSKVTLSKLTAGTKQLTATWKTVSGVTGYEVVYSTSKKFTKKTTKTAAIKKQKTKKTTIKKLKKGKKYYVKVRAYKTVDGKKIYGAYSTVKTVKVK